MTDQQLLDAGERLYKAFLGSNFTFLELAGLAAARERRTGWTELGQNLKLAVFRLVVLSQSEDLVIQAGDQPAPSGKVAATEQLAPENGVGFEARSSGGDPVGSDPTVAAGPAPAQDSADDGENPTDNEPGVGHSERPAVPADPSQRG